jgi:hypothetical protein
VYFYKKYKADFKYLHPKSAIKIFQEINNIIYDLLNYKYWNCSL